MAQYQVPQFIDVEDRIIGSLTLKQFLYLAFAGAILFVTWFIFNIYVWTIIAITIIIIALAFAFLKINDRPFIYFFLSFINYYLRPRLYIFSTVPEKLETKTLRKLEPAFTEASTEKKITRSKLKELALSLDTDSKRK